MQKDQDEKNDEGLLLRHEAFQYLDELRESGVTNMFGARPYLVEEFNISTNEAGDILSDWMKAYRA